MTHKLYINVYFIIFGRPSRSSNLVPRLAVVGVVAAAILTNRGSRKQNTFLIMIMRSRRRGRTFAKGRAGRGMG